MLCVMRVKEANQKLTFKQPVRKENQRTERPLKFKEQIPEKSPALLCITMLSFNCSPVVFAP